MKKFIKMLNPDTADMLISLGFSYITEQLNKQTVYVFTVNDDLMKVLNKDFTSNDYFLDTRLSF